MNSNPKVSIIIPVYNTEKYLSRCLNSLVKQTLHDIEIICINDGSEDNSLSILENYASSDERIVLIDQKNQGQSVARNRGIEIARGKYIGFVDSDDWVDYNYFEKLYCAAENNNCDIAVAGIIRLSKFNKKIYLKFDNEIISQDVNEKFKLCDVPDLSYVVNKIYKREVFINQNFRFEEGRFYEDLILTPQILFYLKALITVPGVYYYYWRRSKSTVTLRSEKVNKDSVYAHNTAKEFIKKHDIDISSHESLTKRYKIFGLTILKIRRKGGKKTISLFNIIKW